jgi:hypothetical protein
LVLLTHQEAGPLRSTERFFQPGFDRRQCNRVELSKPMNMEVVD